MKILLDLFGLGIIGFMVGLIIVKPVTKSSPGPIMLLPTNALSPTPRMVKIVVTGDVLPARTVNRTVVQLNDYLYPYRLVQEKLNQADLVWINLETPLTADCKVRADGMVFCGSVRNVEGLSFAGVDVANIANNHAGNQGANGVKETVVTLDKAQINVTGYGAPLVMVRNGLKIGMLGYNDIGPSPYGIKEAEPKLIAAEVAQLKQVADIVLVQFHWGVEYVNKPTSRQRMLAHIAIDAGADMVVGAHPHWVQGVEKYKDKLITYSLGNFLFDQQWSIPTQQGAVGEFVFSEEGLVSHRYLPVIVDKSLQTRWANEAESEPIWQRMRDGSEDEFKSLVK